MKQTGILLPVSSLPADWGVGELGSRAYEWIDMLKECGASVWQILPLNPTGYGNSPYQPYSSYAGDELYISLELLAKEGLLTEQPPVFMETTDRISYDKVRVFKETYLRKAFQAFQENEEYEEFCKQPWVYEYGVFRAFKKHNHNVCWNEWSQEEKAWPETLDSMEQPLIEEIRYQMFLQFKFYGQWMMVKAYANERNISIMGDVPFYVGVDSQDVWAGKENFLLDAEGKPEFIAGVPPDYFSATGQRWGNPIYDWDYLKQNEYEFWVRRIGYCRKLFDMIRIDHFRAFDTFWKIPVSCPTAVEGKWFLAPGYEVLDTLFNELPEVNLIAEDLGDLRPEVHTLKNHYQLQGMKILQFDLQSNEKYAKDATAAGENLIMYTGTHDNATAKEWYDSLSISSRRKIRKWLKREGLHAGSPVKRFIQYTLKSKAGLAVIPAFDILELGSGARLNTPGTVGSPNWEWKLPDYLGIHKGLMNYKQDIAMRFNQN